MTCWTPLEHFQNRINYNLREKRILVAVNLALCVRFRLPLNILIHKQVFDGPYRKFMPAIQVTL